jgi:N-methylhydantoinase A
VTDADVVLGMLDPQSFLHGAVELDREAAERAVAKIAKPLGLTLHEAAAGINRLVDSSMADLLRRMSVLRGLDPREFACFAYGGMGPVHAAAVAREVGVRSVVVPLPHVAPVWSAFGAAVADVVHVYQRPRRLRMPADPGTMNATFAELEQHGRAVLAEEGFGSGQIEMQRSLRMKYTAQVFDIELPLELDGQIEPDDMPQITAAFERSYERLHGAGSGHSEGGIEITALIVRARALTGSPQLAAPRTTTTKSSDSRQVYWYELGGFAETPVIHLSDGVLEEPLAGPLMIELPDTVIVLRPGQTARFDPGGSLVIAV